MARNPQLDQTMADMMTGNAIASGRIGIPDQYYWFEDFALTLEFVPWSGLFVLTVICDKPIGIGTIRNVFDIPASATECNLDAAKPPRHITIIAWLAPELAEVLDIGIAQPV